MIDYFYNNLRNITDFEPGKKTNKIFSELCDYCIKNDLELNIDEKILNINKYCSMGEYELEKYYSKIISNSDNSIEEFENFIYYDNYEKLTKLEYLNSSFYVKNIKKVLFVGGGPLPLTAIVLAKNYGVKSKILDYSKEAVELSKKLINSLGLQDMIEIVYGDAQEYFDNSKYDICYVASLVFGGKNCEKILSNISKIDFEILLTRTSDGTRELLYKKVDLEILKKIFDVQTIVHPKNDIINSFVINTKK